MYVVYLYIVICVFFILIILLYKGWLVKSKEVEYILEGMFRLLLLCNYLCICVLFSVWLIINRWGLYKKD